MNKPAQVKLFARLLDEGMTDLGEVLDGYGSSVDVPAILFYKELLRMRPQAKLILTVRDSGKEWFECLGNSIVPVWLDSLLFITIDLLQNLRRLRMIGRKIVNKWKADYYDALDPHMHRLHNAQLIKEKHLTSCSSSKWQKDGLRFVNFWSYPRSCEIGKMALECLSKKNKDAKRPHNDAIK